MAREREWPSGRSIVQRPAGRKSRVLRLIVSQGMRPVVIGLVVGTAGALWLSRAMSTLLFNMSAADWPTYAAVAMLLAGAAAFACYVPARAAMRVDVTATLREE
jgi:putative ABC transport system permease protein